MNRYSLFPMNVVHLRDSRKAEVFKHLTCGTFPLGVDIINSRKIVKQPIVVES